MAYDKENIFAKMIAGAIPVEKLIDNEYAIAIRDISPAAEAHVLVMPKGEYVSFDDFTAKASADVVKGFFDSVRQVAGDLGLQDSGYRLIMNHGADASQTVPHFHVHILGGQPLGGLLATDRKIR